MQNQQQEAFQRAANLCSRYEKCSGDIFQKLIQWGLTEDEAFPVLDALKEEKYIDDERFARSFVRDKFRFNKWGKLKISNHLRAKRVEQRLIDEALTEIDESDYLDLLERLLREKNRNLKAGSEQERKAKLFRFAQGRGFEGNLIFEALSQLLTSD